MINKRGLMLGILGLAGAIRGGPAQAGDDSEAAVRDVQAVLDQQVVDWNKGNLDGFLSGYWNSPKVVFMSGGSRFDGFSAMRDRYHRRYKAEGKAMGQLAFSELDVEPLGPEAVLARGRFRLTMPDGTKPTGLFTVIVRKFPEGWKIVHDHTSAEEARQAAKPAEPGETGRESGAHAAEMEHGRPLGYARLRAAVAGRGHSEVPLCKRRFRRSGPHDRRDRQARKEPADRVLNGLGDGEVERKTIPVPVRHANDREPENPQQGDPENAHHKSRAELRDEERGEKSADHVRRRTRSASRDRSTPRFLQGGTP